MVLPENPTLGDVAELLWKEVTGITRTVTKQLSANNTTEAINLFQVTGAVRIFRIMGVIVDDTTLTNCTAAHFDLYDGTTDVDLTDNTGDLSGRGVGSHFAKCQNLSSAFEIANNNQARVTESSTDPRLFWQCTVTQKGGAQTFIRFKYTTTDAPINAQIKFYVSYSPINGGGLTEV